MKKEEKIFFPNLDGIRTVAFLLVFLQHAFYNFFHTFEGNNSVLDSLIGLFFLKGGTGVQIFFVLSGFLITYLILKEIEKNGQINLGFFLHTANTPDLATLFCDRPFWICSLSLVKIPGWN